MGRKKAEAADAPPEVPADTPPAAEPLQVRATEIAMVELGRLVRAPENVRQTHDEAKLAELAEDIAGHGLLQSLIGYDRDEGDDVPIRNELAEAGIAFRDPSIVAEQGLVPLVLICGGGRRLAALEQLRDRGAVGDAYLVPVQIRPRAEAIELSLAENLARQDMNPADQFRGFKRLIDLSGGSVGPADIARRFGYSIDFVRQRMRLADVVEEVLDALAAGKITVDAAYAYASTQDLDVQRRVFKSQEKSTWQPHDPGRIRDEIRGKTFGEGHRLVQFIGLDAYVAAGGQFEDSLFAAYNVPNGWSDNKGQRRLVDTSLVRSLAQDKAKAELPGLQEQAGYAELLLALDVSTYGEVKPPKAPKGAGKIERSYNLDETAMKAIVAQAKKEEVPITGIATVNDKGALTLYDRLLFLPKADADRLRPKERSYGYTPPTPEQVEKERRERRANYLAATLAAPKAEGTPFEGRLQPSGDHVYEMHDEVLGPCVYISARILVPVEEYKAQRNAAFKLYDKEKAQRELQAAQAAEAKAEADRRAAAALTELLVNPPAVVRIDEAPFDFFRHDDGSFRDVRPAGPGLEATPEYGFESLEDLLDYAGSIGSEPRTWPTIEAFDGDETAQGPLPGRCRVCGCTQDAACDPPCDWVVGEDRTLCDNPDCLAKAAEEGAAPPEDAGAHDEPEPVAEAAE